LKLPSKIKGWLSTTTTPERLLENYVSTGDKRYLTKLVEQFNLSIYHYLVSLSDKEIAEDALQTTWLKVMKVKATNHNNTNVKSWLYTIARNTLIDELRHRNKWQLEELKEQISDNNSLVKSIEMDDRIEAFNIAIIQLPFHQRETLIFQQEGFSVMEIAQLTNESFETVKSRLRYARNNLKEMLGAQL